MLNLFLAFLQPRFDPSLADDLAADEVEEGAPGLPGSEPKSSGGFKGLMSGFGNGGEDEEFRPFIRRLPGLSISFASRLLLISRVQVLVLCHQGQRYRFTMYHYPSNRCPRILAYPLDLLLDPLWIDYAQADPVSILLQ
jgi:hypothetical protein